MPNFVKIAQKIAQGPVGVALPSGDDAYWFLVLLFLSVTLWNYEVCDNGNSMKRCNF